MYVNIHLGYSKLITCSSDFFITKMERASKIFLIIFFSENGIFGGAKILNKRATLF